MSSWSLRIFNERAKDMPLGEIRKLPIRDVFKSKEVIGQRKDKTLIPLSSQLCRMEHGGALYVAASLLDLTDEKLAEQKKKIEKVLEKMLPKTLQLRLQRKETKALIQTQFSKSYGSHFIPPALYHACIIVVIMISCLALPRLIHSSSLAGMIRICNCFLLRHCWIHFNVIDYRSSPTSCNAQPIIFHDGFTC
jgi:hypothetical protein